MCKPCQLNVLFYTVQKLLETFNVNKLCKNWTSQNFDPASLNCCKNNTFKYFDLKIWPQEDMIINVCWRVTIYKLAYCLNNYAPKFNGGIFLGHPVDYLCKIFSHNVYYSH